MESQCALVCSRGLLHATDIHVLRPRSSTRHLFDHPLLLQAKEARDKENDGTTIYVCSDAMATFVAEKCIDRIPYRFILVTGDSDACMPKDAFAGNKEALKTFLDHPRLIHWYSQNCVLHVHPKLTAIPIGLDYHTLTKPGGHHAWGPTQTPAEQEAALLHIQTREERKVQCYANFHFAVRGRYAKERQQALDQVDPSLVFYEPTMVPRLDSWQHMAEYAFVLSPAGNGLDCHRTWEALALGCIPIVRRLLIETVFDDLPVLVVNEWSDVTPALLRDTLAAFQTRTFRREKLSLRYWLDTVRSGQKPV